jgi:hypothetical protein
MQSNPASQSWRPLHLRWIYFSVKFYSVWNKTTTKSLYKSSTIHLQENAEIKTRGDTCRAPGKRKIEAGAL